MFCLLFRVFRVLGIVGALPEFIVVPLLFAVELLRNRTTDTNLNIKCFRIVDLLNQLLHVRGWFYFVSVHSDCLMVPIFISVSIDDNVNILSQFYISLTIQTIHQTHSVGGEVYSD